jgi:hypothetical protein
MNTPSFSFNYVERPQPNSYFGNFCIVNDEGECFETFSFDEMEKGYFGEAVDPKLGYDPDDEDRMKKLLKKKELSTARKKVETITYRINNFIARNNKMSSDSLDG